MSLSLTLKESIIISSSDILSQSMFNKETQLLAKPVYLILDLLQILKKSEKSFNFVHLQKRSVNFYLRALKHLFNLFEILDLESLEKKTLKALQALIKTVID